jgi:hypothetical protein
MTCKTPVCFCTENIRLKKTPTAHSSLSGCCIAHSLAISATFGAGVCFLRPILASTTDCLSTPYLQDVGLATADSHELFRLSTSSAAVVVLMKSDCALPLPGELEASLRRQRRGLTSL